MKQLEDLMHRGGRHAALQPCLSPVWDTALSLIAWPTPGEPRRFGRGRHGRPLAARQGSAAAGRLGQDRSRRRAGRLVLRVPQRLLSRHRRHRDGADGPGPHRARRPAPRRQPAAAARRCNWLLAMQNRDGGWAAFDRDINREVLTKVPFADHNAMLDPSCPDITARVLEALGHYGYRVGHPQVDRALAFIARTQEADGCWLGRWGVNYIYGTWQVLVGLRSDRLRHARTRWCAGRSHWLKEVQQADGGWGESCRSYDDPSLAGQGDADRVANRLGLARPDRRRRGRQRRGPRRASSICSRTQQRRRQLARGAVHRHRLPEGLLPEVSHVPALFPADGAGAATQDRGRSQRVRRPASSRCRRHSASVPNVDRASTLDS